jgi:O-antigen/teichoic acid export membrane protein
MGVASRLRQLGGETVVYGLSNTLLRFVSLFLVPFYTRVFTPADYGVMSVLGAAVALLTTFTVLGLDFASGRWYYDTADESRRRSIISSWFWIQLTVSTTIAVLVHAFAGEVSFLLLDSREYALLVILAVWTVPLWTFSKIVGNLLRFQHRAWLTMGFMTFSALLNVAVIMTFVLALRQGLAGMFWGQLAAAGVVAVAGALLLGRWIAPAGVRRGLSVEMLTFALPLVPAALASWVTASANRFILQYFASAEEIGLYSIGVALASAVALGTNAFQLAWTPFALSIHQDVNARSVYARVFSLYLLIGCLGCTGLALFTPLILRILTTPQYYPAASSVAALGFGNLAVGLTYIAMIGANIAKKSAPVAASIFLGAAVNTALNFALIPWLGRDGAAAATLLAYLAAALFLFAYSQRVYSIPFRFGHLVGLAAVSAVAILVNQTLLPAQGWAGDGLRLLLCAAFIPAGLLLGVVTPAELRALWGRLARRIRPASSIKP